ncbi:MAG TPA: transcriptional regulator GcvA [Halothiobacillus sp.]|nr:transcriptional regulator GcvA [Halothiobacillus sp.]
MSRRLPPLTALRAFEAVARHRSMARAAEELHVTPAAVSQQIRQLEDLFGQPLFRRGKQITLTESAEAALPLLSDAFDRLEQAAARMSSDRENGPLVVSSPPAFAARWLMARLEDFQNRHPEIELRLSATRRLVDFDLEDVDCAIRFGDGQYPDLQVDLLIPETFIPVASPTVAADIFSIEDIARKPLLNDEWHTEHLLFPDWKSWLTAQGVSLDTPLRVKHFGESNLTIQAAVSGLGVALAWRSLVEDDLKTGRLVHLLNQHIDTPSAYYLVTPSNRLTMPKVAVFRRWLLEMAANPKRDS